MPMPGGHPCKVAYEALRDAGHDPGLERPTGHGFCPTSSTGPTGGKKPSAWTGKTTVPVLVTDEGLVVSEARNILAWADQHPANSTATASSG